MRFSLVVATLGRPELDRLLKSLAEQVYRDFEVLIVDQGPGDEVRALVERYSSVFPIKYLRSALGLSRARNVGVAAAQGEILAFPDDDAWYGVDQLEAVDGLFRENAGLFGVTGRCTDLSGKLSAGGIRRRGGAITRENVWHSGVSASMFLRREIFEMVGNFDEDLGLGSSGPFQSGEETDLMLRAAAKGLPLIFAPQICVYHPSLPAPDVPGIIEKNWRYALGMGRVLRKHDEGFVSMAGWMVRSLTGALVAGLLLNSAHARLRLGRAHGVYIGWRSKGDEKSLQAPSWLRS
ncbi:MAG: glycosyl transferase family 2 [Hyphomicrobiales bacterium]|nr:glycosyl transferase family 2 [Hyphomicrobiales bacterium]